MDQVPARVIFSTQASLPRAAAFVLLFTVALSQAHAAIALVQKAGKDGGVTSSTSLPFSSDNTAGNLIAVVVRTGAANPQETIHIADSNGNTYQAFSSTPQVASDDFLATTFAANIKGGPNTVTITDNGSSDLRIVILEYSGVAKVNPVETSAGFSMFEPSASPQASVITSFNGDLLLGAFLTSDPESYTPGPGYTLEASLPAEPDSTLVVEDQIQTSAGPSTASVLLGSPDTWSAALLAFKAEVSKPAPVITNLSQNSGPVGRSITITGSNFGSSQVSGSTVTFNGIPAVPSSWSATSIVTPVPYSASTGNIVVTVGGVASDPAFFIITLGPGGISLVQTTSTFAIASTSTLAFDYSNTAGNWIGVLVSVGNSNEDAFSVSDINNNTYQKAVQLAQNQAGNTLALYYAENIKGGFNAVTLSRTGSGTLSMALLEYSGVTTANSLDVKGTGQGNGAGGSTGGFMWTTEDGELVLGGVTTENPAAFSPNEYYTIEDYVPIEPFTTMVAEDMIQISPKQVRLGALFTPVENWAAVMATFKAVMELHRLTRQPSLR